MSYRDFSVEPRGSNWYRRCSPQHMHREPLEATFQLERFDGIFMVVREPLARFRSEYAMRSKRADAIDSDSVNQRAGEALAQYASDSFTWDNHLRPQHEFVVPRAKVFRFESGLDAVARDLNECWEVSLDPDLPRGMDRQTDSGFASETVQVSEELEAHLRSFYRHDFETFGY